MASETVQQLRVELRITSLVTGSDGAQLTELINKDLVFSDGTGANQVGWVWKDETRSLSATNETLDLDALTDFKGATMTDNVNVKVIYLEELGTTTGQTFTVGGGDFASAAGPLVDTTDLLRVGPGGIILLISPTDGFTITASTGDGLKIATSHAQTYRALLAGDNT